VFILCDTCVLLMLLRIAPEMLTDECYNCVIPPQVRDEIFKTQKFKEKYPWRSRFRAEVQPLPKSQLEEGVFLKVRQVVELTSFGINEATGKRFSLSRVDKDIAACVQAFDYQLSTGDHDLRDFLKQEFSVSNVSPLEIVNDWLARALIEWDDEKQAVLEDWKRCGEHAQPRSQVQHFKDITGGEYPA